MLHRAHCKLMLTMTEVNGSQYLPMLTTCRSVIGYLAVLDTSGWPLSCRSNGEFLEAG